MRKSILTLIVVLGLFTMSFAQGNLQFNQVINVSYSATVPLGANNFGTITVPAGKVWKVERTSFSQDIGAILSPRYSASYFVYIGDYLAWNSSSTYPQKLFPLWLSEGTYSVDGWCGSAMIYNFSISAIEFNII